MHHKLDYFRRRQHLQLACSKLQISQKLQRSQSLLQLRRLLYLVAQNLQELRCLEASQLKARPYLPRSLLPVLLHYLLQSLRSGNHPYSHQRLKKRSPKIKLTMWSQLQSNSPLPKHLKRQFRVLFLVAIPSWQEHQIRRVTRSWWGRAVLSRPSQRQTMLVPLCLNRPQYSLCKVSPKHKCHPPFLVRLQQSSQKMYSLSRSSSHLFSRVHPTLDSKLRWAKAQARQDCLAGKHLATRRFSAKRCNLSQQQALSSEVIWVDRQVLLLSVAEW